MIRTFLVTPQPRANSTEKAKEAFQNLVKQLPAEATGIYIAGMSYFKGDTTWLTVAAVVGLLVLIWIRARANVSVTIWLTSIIGYVIWVYTVGDQGPIQALIAALGISLPDLFGAFLVTVYSAVVTVLAVSPPKNG